MDIQRLRNLTTGRLHTSMDHIYQDIDHLTGSPGVMTHMIPNAMWALRPWLRSVVLDDRFWDREHDPTHTGEIDMRVMTPEEKAEFFKAFKDLPNLLEGKEVIVVGLD